MELVMWMSLETGKLTVWVKISDILGRRCIQGVPFLPLGREDKEAILTATRIFLITGETNQISEPRLHSVRSRIYTSSREKKFATGIATHTFPLISSLNCDSVTWYHLYVLRLAHKDVLCSLSSCSRFVFIVIFSKWHFFMKSCMVYCLARLRSLEVCL